MKTGVPRRRVWLVAPLREGLAGREAEPPDGSPNCLKIPHSPSAQRTPKAPLFDQGHPPSFSFVLPRGSVGRCSRGRFVPPPSVPRIARALPVGLTSGRHLAPAAASEGAARGCVYYYIALFFAGLGFLGFCGFFYGFGFSSGASHARPVRGYGGGLAATWPRLIWERSSFGYRPDIRFCNVLMVSDLP